MIYLGCLHLKYNENKFTQIMFDRKGDFKIKTPIITFI